jgi:hypothetical protein
MPPNAVQIKVLHQIYVFLLQRTKFTAVIVLRGEIVIPHTEQHFLISSSPRRRPV